MSDLSHGKVDAARVLRTAEYSVAGDADNRTAASPRRELSLLGGGPEVEVIPVRKERRKDKYQAL